MIFKHPERELRRNLPLCERRKHTARTLENKSSKIPYSAFESDWTGAPIEAKKNLLIFILRTQKPIKMSAINLFSLSLETFTTILRTSWSYFAVLRQVNGQA
nr:PREDICTED: odorant receptor 43a isoform X8 [Tribolium castaneum]|eukprot:XP_015833047.1 PREDICTED: odorant receptor 43a isoform X8 [Tribolium castaneum]